MIVLAVHPARILKCDLAARKLSANHLALALHVPRGTITSILNGKRAITSEIALRLSRYFGHSAQFWMNLQTCHVFLTCPLLGVSKRSTWRSTILIVLYALCSTYNVV